MIRIGGAHRAFGHALFCFRLAAKNAEDELQAEWDEEDAKGNLQLLAIHEAGEHDTRDDAGDDPGQPALQDIPVDRPPLRVSLHGAERGEEYRRQRRADRNVHDVLVAAIMRQHGKNRRERRDDDEASADPEHARHEARKQPRKQHRQNQ